MAKLLIVDDEEKIRELIGKYATHEGYEVKLACNGKQAVDFYSKDHFDVVIMDVMMPELDGYKALEKMKQIDPNVHCIFLTALGQEYDRVYGFDVGGEDYVTKPFSLKELMMRVKVALKREGNVNNKIIVDTLILDEDVHAIFIDGQRIDLANKEYELLHLLLQNIGNALTRQEIISKVWGYEYDSDDRTLDTHMKLLRKDIKQYGQYITTIRGIGYRFEKEI